MTNAPVDEVTLPARGCATCQAIAIRCEARPKGVLCLECFQRTRRVSAFVPRDERLPFGMMLNTPIPQTRHTAHRLAMLAHLSAGRDAVPMASRTPETP